MYWNPVIAGVCTYEEAISCDMKQLQKLNRVAEIKLKMMTGGNSR